jgi:hypothetical protein
MITGNESAIGLSFSVIFDAMALVLEALLLG